MRETMSPRSDASQTHVRIMKRARATAAAGGQDGAKGDTRTVGGKSWCAYMHESATACATMA